MAKRTLALNITNCYLTVDQLGETVCDKITQGSIRIETSQRAKFTIEPIEGYEIQNKPYIAFFADYVDFIKNGDKYELTITDFSNYVFDNPTTIYTTATEIITPIIEPVIETPKYATIRLRLTNCECNIQEGQVLSHEDIVIRVTCAENYEIDNAPVFGDTHETNAIGESVDPDFGPFISHDTREFEFTRISEREYTITVNLLTNITYELVATAALTTSTIEKYGLINAYRLNRHELREIAKHRFIKQTLEAQNLPDNSGYYYIVKDEYLDGAKFIVSLIKINVPVETTQKETVFFGPYNMEIECDIVDTDIVTLDFGSAEITGMYGNSIDFEHTEITLYLPYVGFVELNTTDCMNKSLSITYQVNVLNGDCLIILSTNSNVIKTISCNVAVKIPYKMEDNEYVQTAFDPNNHYLNASNPFLYIKTNKPTNEGILPYHETNFYAILGTLSGYTEATEIAYSVINDFITKSEIDEIKSLISQGIII